MSLFLSLSLPNSLPASLFPFVLTRFSSSPFLPPLLFLLYFSTFSPFLSFSLYVADGDEDPIRLFRQQVREKQGEGGREKGKQREGRMKGERNRGDRNKGIGVDEW